MPTGLAGVRAGERESLQHSGAASYIKPVSGCIKDRWSAGRTGGWRGEEVEHAENQNERENLLTLFCRIFPLLSV